MKNKDLAKPSLGVDLPKNEEKGLMTIKPVVGLNLDETINVLNSLWKKQKQRGLLISTIDGLNDFVFKRSEDDMGESSTFSGCTLSIEDDNRNRFSTNNPVLIRGVVEHLKIKCAERLMEVESEIVLPAV